MILSGHDSVFGLCSIPLTSLLLLDNAGAKSRRRNPKMNWPQENAKIAKKKRYNPFSLSSLRSLRQKSSWNGAIFFFSGTDFTDGKGNEQCQVSSVSFQ